MNAGRNDDEPKRRVLVIDDDYAIRDALSEILRDEGYAVLTASNGAEALDVLRTEEKPGLILLDLMMPIMNGWQFRNQQAHDPLLSSIPVIVISATGNAAQTIVPLEEPIDFLKKPIDIDVLLSTVDRRYRA